MKNIFNGNYKKKAFSMAEIIVVIAIIGIVAVLILPYMTANNKKMEYSAKLSKINDSFTFAIQQAILENEINETRWISYNNSSYNNNSYAFVNKYIIPYINVISYKKTSGNLIGQHGGTIMTYDAKGVLSDGVVFYTKGSGCIDFAFDLNGEKGPNRMGSDIFYFVTACYGTTNKDKSVFAVPAYFVSYGYNRRDSLAGCANKWVPNLSGITCSALLKLDDWKFKDDYPYKL